MTRSVDVVCVTYGNANELDAALSAARPLGQGRLVVVDHGDDGSDQIARDAGALVVRDASNPGFGAGQNRGAALCDAEFILLLNPDCVVDAEAVQSGAQYLAARPSAAAVQGIITNRATGGPERSQGRELGPLHLWGRSLGLRRLGSIGVARAVARLIPSMADHVDRAPSKPVAVESLAATALLLRRAAFEQVGGFDTRFFLYGEDLDLCRRLRAAGWELVALPDAWAVHVSGGSSATTVNREIAWWHGTMQFAARWWSNGRFVSGLAAAASRSISLCIVAPRRTVEVVRLILVAPVRARWRVLRAGSDDLEHPLEGDP